MIKWTIGGCLKNLINGDATYPLINRDYDFHLKCGRLWVKQWSVVKPETMI